jgi:hypothetical protein
VTGCRACAAAWFGVPVGKDRPSCVELTDLQSLSLLVSRDPALGGNGATGSAAPECRSDRGRECRSTGVPGLCCCLIRGAGRERPAILCRTH